MSRFSFFLIIDCCFLFQIHRTFLDSTHMLQHLCCASDVEGASKPYRQLLYLHGTSSTKELVKEEKVVHWISKHSINYSPSSTWRKKQRRIFVLDYNDPIDEHSSRPHFITQGELHDLIRDLQLLKNKAGLLGSSSTVESCSSWCEHFKNIVTVIWYNA